MTPQPEQRLSDAQRVERVLFLANVRKSGLITQEQLARVLPRLPATDRASTVARFLIEQKLLTKFQAERLLVGRTEGFVIGQYRILDQIGRGGMGRVFKAEHATMQRVVALKVLDPALTKTPRARDLFQREVRAAARLTHPNIVTAFDANQVGDRHYLVMEFVDGPNLADLVKEHGPLPVGQACEFVRQAALGLQCAHDHGMVHRDIKPANLLVQKAAPRAGGPPTVKILDFGLARLGTPDEGGPSTADSIETLHQSVMGTPDYLSPEQARCLHSVDARSDLYSLGCTLYYLLTGQVPFPGGSVVEKLLRQTREQPAPVRSLRPEVPAEVERVVATLMAKDPGERYQSAAQVVAALTTPRPQGESAKWVPIAPRPVDETLRASGARLPRVRRPAAPDGADPWAQLDHDPEPDGSLVPTLPGPLSQADDATPLDPVRRSGRVPPPRPGTFDPREMGRIAFVVLLVASVMGAVAFACKVLMNLAGG